MWSTDMVLGFVCYLYGLYFFPGHDTQAHLLYDSSFALPCCCLPSNSLAMVKLEPSVAAQVWSAWSYPVLSRFWTSTSVQWQCSLSKLNFCDVFHSVQTEFLTLNILSSTCDLFCRFWSWVWPEDVLQAFSLGFSLGKSCNFPFSFLFIIIHQFLYQKYCKDYVFCVDDQ
jgi:hypothetical protein